MLELPHHVLQKDNVLSNLMLLTAFFLLLIARMKELIYFISLLSANSNLL